MTLEKLRQYRSICEEIKELEIDMKKNTEHSVVRGSDNFFPYISHSMAVSGLKNNKENNNLRNKLHILRLKKKEIEDYINSIEDILTYRIFKYRFIKGYSWSSIAVKTRNTVSCVKMICYRYIKNTEKQNL